MRAPPLMSEAHRGALALVRSGTSGVLVHVYTAVDMASVCAALGEPICIECIVLHAWSLRPADTGAFFAAIAHNTTLTELACAVGCDMHTIQMCLYAQSYGARIDTLNLCGIHAPPAALNLDQVLARNTRITHVNMGLCRFGDAAAVALAEVLRHNTTMTHLEVDGNDLTAHGIAVLGDALGGNTTLATLDLSDNFMESAGVTEIAHALRRNTALTALHLTAVRCGSDACTALTDALRAPSSRLNRLDVRGNAFGDAGLDAFSELLTSGQSTLRTLYVGNTAITLTGIATFARALASATALTELDLRGTVADTEPGALALCAALRVNTTLEWLHMDLPVTMSAAMTAGFGDMLRHNFVIWSIPHCVAFRRELCARYRRHPLLRAVVRLRIMCQEGRAVCNDPFLVPLFVCMPLWVVRMLCLLI